MKKKLHLERCFLDTERPLGIIAALPGEIVRPRYSWDMEKNNNIKTDKTRTFPGCEFLEKQMPGGK